MLDICVMRDAVQPIIVESSLQPSVFLLSARGSMRSSLLQHLCQTLRGGSTTDCRVRLLYMHGKWFLYVQALYAEAQTPDFK
jgi:hypothetical protein